MPIEIYSVFAPHDYTNFLDHAQHILRGEWFGPYDDLTLIKGPGMPLYLALIARIGLPLPLAHQLLYALATLTVSLALAPLVRLPRLLAASFVALLFNPWTYSAPSWIANRSQLKDSLTFFVMAGAIGAVVRAKDLPRVVVPWMVLLGFAVSMFGLTREDTPWIVGPLLVFLAAYLWIVRRDSNQRIVRFALPAIPFAIFVASFATIMLVNNAYYGWPTTVEDTSPELTSAYQSLARIIVPGIDNRTYPAPTAALDMAYRASPAAAELKGHFDQTRGWRMMICGHVADCEIPSGFFVYVFRDAVAAAGHYDNGADARAFYLRLSRELDAACADGRLNCRPKSFGLAPNVGFSDIPAIIWWANQAFWHSMTYDQYDIGGVAPYNSSGLAWKPVYDAVAGSGGGTRTVYQGWLLRDDRSAVTLDDAGAGDLTSIAFEDSPDIRAAFGAQPEYKHDDLDHARFDLTTTCAQNCSLVVTSPGQPRVSIPLTSSMADVKQGDVALHVDSESTDPAEYDGNGFKLAALKQLASAYQQLLRIWAVAVAVLLLVRVIRLRRKRRAERTFVVLAVTLGIVTALAADCFALGLVSAISFDALLPEYEIALSPLLLLALGTLTATEGDVAYRWIRRRLPSGAQTLAADA